MAESVAAALEGRSRLLVFDNCEHVLDAAADIIEAIFARSSTVKDLGHAAGKDCELTRNSSGRCPHWTWTAGSDSAAAALFTDRAQAVSRRVSFGCPSNLPLCWRSAAALDGIPLAIELAASRMLRR